MVTILAIDVLIIGRRPHEPSMKEAGLFIGIYVTLAVLFGFGVWAISGPRYAGEFFAGWITEYSLSIDNLFIFLIILTKLKVPRHLQQFALLVGIILALIFRGIFHRRGRGGHQPFQLGVLYLRGVPDMDRREALSRLSQA
jgi:tellurite resistance protein TerC